MTPQEKIDALFALSTELLKTLKSYQDSTNYYWCEADGNRYCIHCDNAEYRPHEKSCPVTIGEKLIPKAREVLESME